MTDAAIIRKLVDKVNDTYTGADIARINDLFETGFETRICDVCGKLMVSGYVFDGGSRYFCSDKCLHTQFTDEEWEQEYNSNEDSYWTEWC